MAAVVNNPEETPTAPKPSPSPGIIVSSAGSSQPSPPTNPTTSITAGSSAKDHILSVASKIASQPLQNSDHDVWAVLTAISANARKRHQVKKALIY